MYGRLSILYVLALVILGAYPVCAQDTVDIVQRVRTEQSVVVRLVDQHYRSPSLKRFLRSWDVSTIDAGHRYESSDRYIYQEGSGYRQLGVSAASLRHVAKGTLWGDAQYQNKRTFGVNYNESLDYEIIAPYVMADTVGGSLQTERYAFRGGYAWQHGRWGYGAEAGFRGDQGYRDRDPRLNAVVADIDATLAASVAISSRYQLATSLGGSRYRQVNHLDFVSEVGTPLVYHDAGLGVFNTLLAGTRTDAYYTGYSWAPTVYLAPTSRQGWMADIGYRRFSMDKELSNILDPIAKISAGTWSGAIGYATEWGNKRLYAGAQGQLQQRNGYEARFNNRDAETGMTKIDEALRYVHDHYALALNAAFEREGPSLRWAIAGTGGYVYNSRAYVDPTRRMEVGYLHGGVHLSATKSWSATWLTAQLGYNHRAATAIVSQWADVSPGRGIYQMLAGNFAYLSASQQRWKAALRTEVQLNPALVGFVNIDGQLVCYDADHRGGMLGVNVGFLF
ncbi:DUF6850 family outer membrane beta-barrel protein [Parapedobacter sp. 10938]|uniref:DUF6850 family outer membrane beta-barrel protein n=1 Tax=Parapedobacter flavus TaxID=3110225 RepID=UPI002DB8022D|nr:DUF6850 family outer membrane beta-barrel protein [Parapedobacter sp. 10938]MEC3879694.1 hypothetical protein [Parapedobacter sp. 10938]